jgi:hypothetical protein
MIDEKYSTIMVYNRGDCVEAGEKGLVAPSYLYRWRENQVFLVRGALSISIVWRRINPSCYLDVSSSRLLSRTRIVNSPLEGQTVFTASSSADICARFIAS